MQFINKYRAFVAATFTLSVVLIGLVVALIYGKFSHRPPCLDGRQRMGAECNPDEHFVKLLNLKDEQVEKYLQAKSLFQQQHDSLAQEIRSVSIELIKETMQENPSQPKIDLLVVRFGELQKNQKMVMIRHIEAVKPLLNDEQQNILKRMMCRMDRGSRASTLKNCENAPFCFVDKPRNEQ